MKNLRDYGESYLEFLDLQDDSWIFTNGACHAFALEMAEFLRSRGVDFNIIYVSGEHPATVRHIVVKQGESYWDVHGRNTLEDITNDWVKSDFNRIRPVEHVGWISKESCRIPKMSYLGLLVDPVFLERARERARKFIESHSDRFSIGN